MREIKFRAWDYGIKIWSYIQLPLTSEGSKLIKWENIDKLYQFTGLKDKNGKDIYEGDIVQTSIGKITVTDLFCNFVIYTYEDIDRMNDPEKHIEIIGNIYEKGNLLNGNEE